MDLNKTGFGQKLHIDRPPGLIFFIMALYFCDKAFNIFSDHIRFNIDGIPDLAEYYGCQFCSMRDYTDIKTAAITVIDCKADAVH